ncbi:hypothetical protein [Halobacterium zhouii]|uniref:hypothetical protein n=1 Tax=Halobacterium zhouii TaxID=2902624 RepID=UPI001E486305|nr:hypothetical protein [Halobacterium zhouii]
MALTRVGVLGPGAEDAAGILREFDADPVVGDEALEGKATGDTPTDADDEGVDVLVALGEDALLDVVAARVDAPVLPVAAGEEYGGVLREGLRRALAALAGGEYEIRDRPTLAVSAPTGEHRALADATLVTTHPGKISEFAVRGDGEHVDQVRADGVVAATPAGSHGYAAAAGGPLLQGGADSVAVVPIAPFRVEQTSWVLDLPVECTVTRNVSDVSLFVDGRECGAVPAREPLELEWGAPTSIAVVPDSRSAPSFES